MMIRRLLAACLVAAPVLMCAAEVARLSIPEASGEAGRLAAIAAERGTWETFAWLTLALVMAWLGAALGLVEAVRDLNPRAAWIGGVVAVTGAVAFAMHQMQYVEINAVLSSSPDYIKAAQQQGVEGTTMEDITVLIELVGLWLGPIILVAALARAGTVAWWKFACVAIWVVLFVFTGSISPVFAAVHLVLLPPFLSVAHSLVQTARVAAAAAA